MTDSNNHTNKKDILIVSVLVVIIMYGALVSMHELEKQFYKVCENKTGIIKTNGDFSQIDCDCWQRDTLLPERCYVL